MTSSALPAHVGRYEVIDLIGRGGMGVVYRARDPHIGRIVAVKVLKASGERMRSRFLQEIRLLGTLNHTSIVGIYDCGFVGEQPYIVMEFVEGVTLADFAVPNTPIWALKKLRLVHALCSALEYAHGRGIVHRDIKPANLMIDREGVLKVLDFGVARYGEAHATMTGALVGTPSYMAPEQVSGGHIDKRTDIFAVGLVLYELMASAQAFPAGGRSVWDVMQAVLSEQPAALSSIVADVDPALERIVNKAIEKDPAARYDTLSLLAKDLTIVEARYTSRVGLEQHEAPTILTSADRPPLDAQAAGVAAAPAVAEAAAVARPSRLREIREVPLDVAASGRSPERPAPVGTTDPPIALRRAEPPALHSGVNAPRVEPAPARHGVKAPILARVSSRTLLIGGAAALAAIAIGVAAAGRLSTPNTTSPQPQAAQTQVDEPPAPAPAPPADTPAVTETPTTGVVATPPAALPADDATPARTPFQISQAACDNGRAQGCFRVGVAYATGRGVAKDEALALAFYKRACDGKSADGCRAASTLMARQTPPPQNHVEPPAPQPPPSCSDGSAPPCIERPQPPQSPTPAPVQPIEAQSAPSADRLGRVVRLGVPPAKVSHVPEIYPPAARAAGVTGIIIVEVLIDRAGNVVRTKVLRPINPLLDDAAETAIRQWKYAPTVIRGESVSVTTTVTVNFGVK